MHRFAFITKNDEIQETLVSVGTAASQQWMNWKKNALISREMHQKKTIAIAILVLCCFAFALPQFSSAPNAWHFV